MLGRAGWLGLALGLASATAQAQQSELLDAPETRCLTVVAGAPAAPIYPESLLAWKVDGKVSVTLRFDAPDQSPRVEVTSDDSAHDDFRRAVRQHAGNLRVPCMVAGTGPVVLRQVYDFRHDDRKVEWSIPEDLNAPQRRQQLACVAHVGGKHVKPVYPVNALRNEYQGRAILRLTFTSPDAEPQVEEFGIKRWNATFSRSAAEWAKGLRMPCHGGGAVQGVWSFVFHVDESKPSTLKDMPLATFLSAVKGIREQRASFDFNTMGCPFDVKLQYLRPHLPNRIGEVSSHAPSRRPLLEWLSGLALDLTPQQEAQLIGSDTTLTVPCGTLQL